MSNATLLPERQPPHLTETACERTTVWRGHFLQLRRDRVRLPDGRQAWREYLHHPGAVMIIPLLDDGRVVVERQYRYPVAQAMIEFPAGKRDAGEAAIVCAERELREETGYTAREWARAGVLHPAIGYADESIEIWFARGLQAGPRALDDGEHLDVLCVEGQALLDAVRDGRVTDGKTLAGLLWWERVHSGRWSLDWWPARHWATGAGAREPRP
ncbi:NUDIX domain-containing protein [Tepidimonas charontis]|uniref:GDP-mannose pyrophosphatase n=1 Tax=Tepidimonas charontis TaxID=2267262 RepID=A0A554XCT0_9BURK|nr:NUDIX hydrolase [Tepidimonas charontis]TSE33638.1 ADP-ribose pyrophosphatase [Tepidimonas charontis]